MAKLEQVVKSLIKAKAGGQPGEADKANIVYELNDYTKVQREWGFLLLVILLFLLAAPLCLIFFNIPKETLLYLFGGSGIFAAGNVKLILDRFRDVHKAHTLVMICRGMDSKDAKDILSAWLNEQNAR